jgi:hypothetical protein
MVVNGACSRPKGLSAKQPLCVGAQLSVPAWLAISGLEFTLLRSILLPRLVAQAISKYLVRILTTTGMPISELLNSMSAAPLMTQAKGGRKRILIPRSLTALVVITISILYKFSFTRVNASGTVSIPAIMDEFGYSLDFTRFGDWNYAVSDGNRDITARGMSLNLLDMLSGRNASVRYFWSGSGGSSGLGWESPQDLILGPTVNNSQGLSQLLNATVETCEPLVYARCSFSSRVLMTLGRTFRIFLLWEMSHITMESGSKCKL